MVMNHILRYSNTLEHNSVFIDELGYKLPRQEGFVITAPVYSQVSFNLFQVLPTLATDTDLSKMHIYTEEMFFKDNNGEIYTYSCKDRYRLRRFLSHSKSFVGKELGTINLSRVVVTNSFGTGTTLKLNGTICMNNRIDYSTGDIELDFSYTDDKGKPISLLGLVVYLSDA